MHTFKVCHIHTLLYFTFIRCLDQYSKLAHSHNGKGSPATESYRTLANVCLYTDTSEL